MNFEKCYKDLLSYQFVQGNLEDLEEELWFIAG
jgi:hypothetical protein